MSIKIKNKSKCIKNNLFKIINMKRKFKSIL